MRKTANRQLINFLSDMYSVEQQALVQMKGAPEIAGEKTIADNFRKHYAETELHSIMIYERLMEHGVAPNAVKDMIMKLGGEGFLLFARIQPETIGKLLNHAFSYEAMELSGYEMLKRFAEQVDDHKTVDAAQLIKEQELAMMLRVKGGFTKAEEMVHGDLSKSKLNEHLKKHLDDVHAISTQSKYLLKKSEELGKTPYLLELYKHQHEQTQKHIQLIETHLKSLEAEPSKLKDSALAIGALNWGLFFQYQSDTPAKLAAFIFALLHLEMGGYELLQRTASRAGDKQLVTLCKSILKEKENMALVLMDSFDAAAKATLEFQ